MNVNASLYNNPVDYYIFSIKHYLRGGTFEKVFTAEQHDHSKHFNQKFVTPVALAIKNIWEIRVLSQSYIPFYKLKNGMFLLKFCKREFGNKDHCVFSCALYYGLHNA